MLVVNTLNLAFAYKAFSGRSTEKPTFNCEYLPHSGGIPPSLGDLSALLELVLSSNMLSGGICGFRHKYLTLIISLIK